MSNEHIVTILEVLERCDAAEAKMFVGPMPMRTSRLTTKGDGKILWDRAIEEAKMTVHCYGSEWCGCPKCTGLTLEQLKSFREGA